RACLCCLRPLEQHSVVQQPGLGVRAVQRLATTRRLAVAGALPLVAEPHPGLLGEAFHRLAEGEVLHSFDELDDVAALATAEAVKDLLRWADGEAGGLFLVERTQAGERVAAGFLQLEVARDNLDDVRALPDRVLVLRSDASCHVPLPRPGPAT